MNPGERERESEARNRRTPLFLVLTLSSRAYFFLVLARFRLVVLFRLDFFPPLDRFAGARRVVDFRLLDRFRLVVLFRLDFLPPLDFFAGARRVVDFRLLDFFLLLLRLRLLDLRLLVFFAAALPPRFSAPGEFEMRAARCLLIPFLRRPSYCSSSLIEGP